MGRDDDELDSQHPHHFIARTGLQYHQIENPPLPLIELQMTADTVWPLLVDDISTGERTGVALRFAEVLIHELSHAATMYVRCGRIASSDAPIPGLDSKFPLHRPLRQPAPEVSFVDIYLHVL